jgi:hypothetical protein
MPLLAEAMQGALVKDRPEESVLPHTLTLWLEGSYVKFVLSAGPNHPKFFGSFQGLDAGLEEVEKCLAEGRGDWKIPGRRLRS